MWVYFWSTAASALLLFTAPAAEACVQVTPEHQRHQLNREASEVDQTPPTPPQVTVVEAWRRAGEVCRTGRCTASSCGDTAALELRFHPSQDDLSPTAQLGYRVEVVAGHVPSSMQQWLHVDLRSTGELLLPASYQEIEQLDAVLQLVAVDAAGNESSASEPFLARYEGCSKALFDDDCQLDCTWADQSSHTADPALASQCHEGLRCSLTTPGRSPASASLWLLSMLGVLQILRRRR